LVKLPRQTLGRTAYATQSQHGVTETPSRKSFTDTVEE
jgi:hypothetical protein